MSFHRLITVLTLLPALMLLGCGAASNGSGDGSTNVAEGGVSGTGITAGTVNGFGSIIVNGSRHATDAIEVVTRDDQAADVSDFRIGEVVLIEWELDDDGVTRNARKLTYESELHGPVTAPFDSTSGDDLKVLDQVVKVSDLTVLVGLSLVEELVVDQVVRVSGFRRADGSVQATLIEIQDTSGPVVDFNGFVTRSDPGLGTFEVNDLRILTGNAVIIPNDFPEVGDLVRVKGELSGAEVDADTVKIRPAALAGKKGALSEIEGLVTAVRANSDAAAADFDVSGLRVTTNSQTEYNDSDVTDITDDARVEIEGSFGNDGSLVAEQIKVLPAAEDISIKLEADVHSIDLEEQSITLRYGVQYLEVVTDALTQFEDASDQQDAEFKLGDLVQFHHVEVRGYLSGSVVTATRVERKDTELDTKRKLQGPVTDIDGGPGAEALTILGIGVETSAVTEFKPAGRDDFFDALDMGDVVSAGGRDNGSSVDWEELEREYD